MTGTEFDATIKNLNGAPRDLEILHAIDAGYVPAWFDTWEPVSIGPLTIFTKLDYVSIGTNDNFRRVAMRPSTAQTIASKYNAILPTRKLVAEIYRASNKLQGKPIPPDALMETSKRFAEHDALIGKVPAGKLVAGHKKDIVVGPELDGSKVAIYGWQPDSKVFPHQPYSTIHDASYADYSHGVRLVSRYALLDGQPVDILSVFSDPKTVGLVSDQGMFVPVFPNKGAAWPQLQDMSVYAKKGAPAGMFAGAIAGGLLGGPVGVLIGGALGAALDKKS